MVEKVLSGILWAWQAAVFCYKKRPAITVVTILFAVWLLPIIPLAIYAVITDSYAIQREPKTLDHTGRKIRLTPLPQPRPRVAKKSPGHKLAIVDSVALGIPDKWGVRRYESLVAIIAIKCKTSKISVADSAVRAQSILKDRYERKITLRDILEQAQKFTVLTPEEKQVAPLFARVVVRYK